MLVTMSMSRRLWMLSTFLSPSSTSFVSWSDLSELKPRLIRLSLSFTRVSKAASAISTMPTPMFEGIVHPLSPIAQRRTPIASIKSFTSPALLMSL